MRRIMALSDETKIAGVSGLCLMGLVIVLKNVVHVAPEVLSHDIILYIPFYLFCGWFPSISGRREKKSRLEGPLIWSLVILAVTAGIITVYAV